MSKVKIEITGRIPKYFFGALKEEFRLEIKQALDLSNGSVETENDFVNLIFNLALDGLDDAKERIYNCISKENLESLPNLNRVVNEKHDNHFHLIDRLFDSPRLSKYGSEYGISFFEDDANISISNENNNEGIVQETTLQEFSNAPIDGFWGEEVEEGGEGFEDLQRINELISSNVDFGFSVDDGLCFGWEKNEMGCTFLDCELNYPDLEEFLNSNEESNQVTIYFDDITNWTFVIDTKDQDFDAKNLTFVNYRPSEEFRNSAREIIFSHLFYKNDLILPEENLVRDKGITLTYGDSRELESLNFFLNQ